MIRKLAKYLLPHGVVEILRNRRELGKLGRLLAPSEWLCSDRLLWQASESGLSLVPSGLAKDFKYVVDVGANEGQWSSMMLACINPIKAIVFEPVPETFAKLQAALGDRPNVELRNVVVGERQGSVRFNVTRDSKGASVLQPGSSMKVHVADQWDVVKDDERPMDTLDHQLADLPEVSLLKIDVQGFEKQVLAGAVATLKKTRFVLVELNFFPQYKGGATFDEIHKLLTETHGFFLCNLAPPQRFGHEAIYVDGLYANSAHLGRR